MSLFRPFPPMMFDQSVIVHRSSDAVSGRGGANPSQGAGVSFNAYTYTREEQRTDTWGNANTGQEWVAVTCRYWGFACDPNVQLGDQIDWKGKKFSVLDPADDKGGKDIAFVVRTQQVQ